MLVRALLQTSLVLWLAQQTLQSGVRPQTVSWGRGLPARGVGVGVRPGVAAALGALGSRYGTKAMKTGIGRYPAAHLGAEGYRALGYGGRAGMRQGGYGAQGAYGAQRAYGAQGGYGAQRAYGAQGAYGAQLGMGMGTGLTNGLGLGHGGKRVYGGDLGTLPGYGAGMGYHGARPGIGLGYPTGQKAKEHKPGVSAADLGGPQLANLGQAVQDLKSVKSRASGPSYGDRTLGAEMPNMRRAQRGDGYDPMVLERSGAASHGATLAELGVRQQLPLVRDHASRPDPSRVQSARDYDSSIQQNQRGPNCGSTRDLSGAM
ncbi:fibroin heavy chain [Pseudoliparis swirei]|uniref:fibroin heavy chain n=1 Tax=Pseudoliparis swirei TaxID=2059687 RepID=UPI0024BE83E3|nr:fibroin heavy chain [Pseudoliparis swirei]